jgi:hypothetical protein
LFNGRRIHLDALASQAQAMWRTRAGLVPHSASIEWLSRALLLALFAVVIISRDVVMNFQWRELPAALLPFAVIALAGGWLRRMKGHIITAHMSAPVLKGALPFEAAPLLRRMQLDVTAWLARWKATLMLLPIPHIHLDEHEAVQTLMLFAQRMSRNWLELRALIEAAIERIFMFVTASCDWIISPLQALLRTCAGMSRTPRVIVLRC